MPAPRQFAAARRGKGSSDRSAGARRHSSDIRTGRRLRRVAAI